MPFTTIEYTVPPFANYWSVSRYLISEDEEFQELERADDFVEEVVVGLQLYLKYKELKAREVIKLIKEIDFYLNLLDTKTFTSVHRTPSEESNVFLTELRKLNSPLCFNIALFRDYKKYDWFVYKNELEYGEIGLSSNYFIAGTGATIHSEGIRGDKKRVKRLRDGYVYVFDEEEEFKTAFVVKSGRYQEVKLSENDCTYTDFIGEERVCGRIPDFFKEEEGYHSKGHFFVASEVAFSKDRLFGTNEAKIPQIKPSKLGYAVSLFKYSLRSLNKDTRSGPEILEDFRIGTSVTFTKYALSFKTFPREDAGITIHLPDPLEELRRRTAIFQERYEEREKWFKDNVYTRESFLHEAIDSMITRDPGLKGYVNEERMRGWQHHHDRTNYKYRSKVYYALKSLIEWLESDQLTECLFNHIEGSDEDFKKAVEIYGDALVYLDQQEEGLKFYEEQFQEEDSFMCRFWNLHENAGDEYLKRGFTLEEDFEQTNEFTNAGFTVRKIGQGALGMTATAAPALVKFLKKVTVNSLVFRILNSAGFSLSTLPEKTVQPLLNSNKTAKIIDVNRIANIETSIRFNQFKSFLEIFNVCLSIHIYYKDENPDNQAKNTIAIIGALLDFGAEGHWIVAYLKKKKLNYYANSKFIPIFQLVSGIIDCYLGVDGAVSAHRDGNYRLSLSYGIFAVGGVLTAVGAGLIIGGKATTAASGGLLVKVGGIVVLAGCLIEGIGLAMAAYFDNRDIKDWIADSIFGVNSEVELINPLGDRNYHVRRLDKQIERLNDILCDFRVEADFHDTVMQFTNYTRVTITIFPRLITDTATIEFTNVRAIAEARVVEYIQGGHHLAIGAAGSTQPTLEVQNVIDNPDIVEKNSDGTIKSIKQTFYYRMDIDNWRGDIAILFNNGTLQGRKKEDFDLWP